MARFDRSDVGPRKLLDTVNKLDSRLTYLERMTGGPGIQIRRSAAGIAISATAVPTEQRSGGGIEYGDCNQESMQSMDCNLSTQDTDTWDRDSADGGCIVPVITDVWYDTSDHAIKARVRYLWFDEHGMLCLVTAESDSATITTAVKCD